ncbi:hypothetical protein N7478_000806 [Penicillium angulare]|uniref:uncharacterized protein n=1 Tax=Penicillium angulare TaxID=116970 RepID=UPI00253F8A0A|nr:uncharacterized protein N7478_000806 [Penicillium angulare]KAJ5291555.1 hypothetical protein N7478_000806 [Penicillium angulare]
MENPNSLTELSALVERTLLDTGRLFRKSGSMPTSTHLQRSIPAYYEGFQEALDNLTEQIFIAKAFLEKDYEAIKAREAVPITAEDVAMDDVDQKLEQEAQPSEPIKTEMGTEPSPAEAKVANDVPAPTEAAPVPQPTQDAAVKEEKQTKKNEPVGQDFTDNADGLNFDSVLNEGGGGSGSFHLSLDFDDDMGNQAFLSGSAFGSTGPNDQKTGTSQPPENSMTAPAGGGAFDMELQKSEGDPTGNIFPDQGTGMDDLMGPGESSFDDLFMETENMGGDGTDLNQLEGDSLMNLNELDDNWFT